MAGLTKKAIIDSFIKLLNKQALDKIKVKDIVEDCHINRNTFYYYFEDIYSLLDEIFRMEAQRFVEETNNYASWREGLLDAIRFIRENKRAIVHIYNSINREMLEQYLHREIGSIVYDFVKKEAQGLTISEENLRFVADFYLYAIQGMVLSWIRQDMKEDPESMIDRLVTLFDGTIQMVLKNSLAS